MPTADVTVVLPTFDRAEALRDGLPELLAMPGVAEVVVVDDGSGDATPAVLAEHRGEPRLRVLRLPRTRGTPAARNRGVAAARTPWVLFGEDDCRFPPDYAEVLRAEADAHGADVVGAPMVHPDGRPLPEAVAAARAAARGDGGLDQVAGFPPAPVVTPLLPAPALVRRAVAERLRFDEGFAGNGYREETDFFLRAARAGHVCLLTPATCFWEPRRWPRPGERSRLADELWRIRNNGRLLRRHGRWLAERGLIADPVREQLAFTARRVGGLARRR